MTTIMGINTDEIDEAKINAHLERYGIEPTGKLNRKLRILARHIADLKKSTTDVDFDSCTCSKCGGESPGALSECPYCGEGDTEDPSKAEEPKAEEPKAEEPKAEKPPKRSTAKAATKKKVVTKKKTPARKTKATKVEPADDGGSELATVVETPSTPTKYGAADLQQSVVKCRAFMSDATLECYRLGHELNFLNANNLYLLDLTGEGKSKYTSFKAFVRTEFGMSHQQAYNLMHVAENFTEEQVRQMGTTKLNLALKLPAEVREEILAAAKEGESMTSLSERANALLEKNTPPKPAPVGKQLTAIIAMGLMEAPMYKAPTQPGKVGAPTELTGDVNDEPFAVFTLENGVEATFQLLRGDDGNFRASLSFRRGSGD